ncbi:MAG: PadR family transcriptional regulator [Phycisphaerae bacterium]|jgi:DNA-binding PadR family transcriptional regulator|nr:PadR family transcriptional regulator [Phycisphaerae bacterium]
MQTPSKTSDSTRDWLRGSLDLAVLSALSSGEKYGYQILAELRRATDGRIDLKAGTLYPALHALEAQQLVKSRWDDASGRDRKWYSLTAAGRRRLRDRAREWLEFTAAVRRLLESALGGGDALATPPANG